MDDLAPRLAAALRPAYELGERLGEGGCAVVYRARDVRLGREVAIKTLKPGLDADVLRARFRREGETAARLTHPHVLSVHDVGEGGGCAWLVMPLVRGGSLADRVARDGPLAVPEAVPILRAVASALGHAHASGVVHRDVKPENVLLDATASGGHPLLTDFGVAKVLDAVDADLTATGVVVGTPAAMAPEQLAGDAPVDARTDVWAFGVLAYRVLGGRAPFVAPTVMQLVGQVMTAEPTPLVELAPAVPTWLDAIVARCLAKDPADRFADARALEAALAVGPANAAPVDAPARRTTAVREALAAPIRVVGWRAPVGGLAVVAATAGGEAALGAGFRATPVVALLTVVGVAIAVGQARAAQAVPAGAPKRGAGLQGQISRLRAERRVTAAILLQMPRAERARLADVLGVFDTAIAEAQRAAEVGGAGARETIARLLERAQQARTALEHRATEDVDRAVGALSDATRSTR